MMVKEGDLPAEEDGGNSVCEISYYTIRSAKVMMPANTAVPFFCMSGARRAVDPGKAETHFTVSNGRHAGHGYQLAARAFDHFGRSAYLHGRSAVAWTGSTEVRARAVSTTMRGAELYGKSGTILFSVGNVTGFASSVTGYPLPFDGIEWGLGVMVLG